MDVRTYTLLAIAVICLLFAVLTIRAFVRYRRAVRLSREIDALEDDGREAYLGTAAEHADDVFAVPGRGHAPAARVHVRPEAIPEVHREPEPEPAHAPAPEPEPEPEPAPAPAPEPDPEPEPEPRPVSEPEPEPERPPGYSLADELERLMEAADAQTTLLSPEAHAAAVATPVGEDTVTDEPTFEQPPVIPAITRGEVLSAPVDRAEAIGDAPPQPHEPVSAALTPEMPESVPDYELVAPVELHFTGGGGRVGVRPGSRTYDEFQRLAAALLERGESR